MRLIQSFQSTYWTRSGWAMDGEQSAESVLTKYPLRKILAAASITSWITYAPNYRRVLYVDQASYDIISGWGWTNLWHEVHVLNFAKILKGISFYASSKPYTWTLQSEPFWSVDLDCYLTEPLDASWFDPTEWYGETWKAPLMWDSKPDWHLQDVNDRNRLTAEESSAEEWFKKYYSKARGTYVEKLDRMLAVNAGLVFCPNPDQGNLIGLATLELEREMSKAEWGTAAQVIEEIPLANWVPLFGKKIRPTVNGSFYKHHYAAPKDRVVLDQVYANTITEDLGYDPVEVANKLSKAFKEFDEISKIL